MSLLERTSSSTFGEFASCLALADGDFSLRAAAGGTTRRRKGMRVIKPAVYDLIIIFLQKRDSDGLISLARCGN
jgi:hypothetical protein